MLIDYPMEWRKYMIKGKTRTFSQNTPLEIKRNVFPFIIYLRHSIGNCEKSERNQQGDNPSC